MTIEKIPSKIKEWAKAKPDIHGIALVGSFARDQAREDSDIDLIILCKNKEDYLNNDSWIETFGKAIRIEKEYYGKISSLRVWYDENGPEVEFGLADNEWTSLPLDEKTAKVINAGIKILYDPHLKLTEAFDFVNRE